MKKIISALLCVLMVLSSISCMGTYVAAVLNATPVAGDINGDGATNNKDLTRLMKYLAGDDVETVWETLDPNGDETTNNKDLTRLMRYLAGEPVEIFLRCSHEIVKVDAKEATCVEEGNIEYWYCSKCEKYFDDETALKSDEITHENTVIETTGHVEETIPDVEPTYDSYGSEGGVRCKICGYIIVEPIPLDPLGKNETFVKYDERGNLASDMYLKDAIAQKLAAGEIIHDNPSTINTTESAYTVKSIDVDTIPGYTFLGWYDGPGDDAKRVAKIPEDTTGYVELFAKWKKESYTITFDSPEVPWDSITYTVDTGATLTNPSWFGYTFVGWSEDGQIVKDIPVGTIGNKTLHANWTSNRNKAVSKPLTSPEIVEDFDNNRYLFVYEIGKIVNVPLNEIQKFEEVDEQLEINNIYEYSQTVDEEFIKTAATAVSNATTKTSAWTLSEDWNTSTSATNSHEEEKGKTKEKTDREGNVYESQYYVSNVSGGCTSSSSNAGGSSSSSSKITTDTSTGISSNYSKKNEVDTSVNLSVEASVGASWGPINAEVKGGISKNTSTHDEEAFNCSSNRDTYVGTYNENNNNSYWDTSSTSSASWNTTNSYQTSSATSVDSTVSQALSEVIYDRWGYSSTEDVGGGSSETNSTDETKEKHEEYVSTIERSTEVRNTLRKEIKQTYKTSGYYRLITVGTLNVFAVVGYDVATKSYFTYTYSILDSKRDTYMDYSKTGSFTDCENAVLPFTVPYEVHEYISDVTARSDGLKIGSDGIVSEYTGNATQVIIPEYTTDGDGTAADEAIRVRGIDPDAFAGNTKIKAVSLPKYVTEIPDGAFAGCTSLESVFGYSISSIGDYAFAGCTSLDGFTIDEYFTSIGENAFEGVGQKAYENSDENTSANIPGITVNVDPDAIIKLKKMDEKVITEEEKEAGKEGKTLDEVKSEAEKIAEDVVLAAIYSGAKKITVDISKLGTAFSNEKIVVDDSTEYFAVVNNVVNTYENLQIESAATVTYLGGMKFVDNTGIPLKFKSEKVTLSKVTVEDAPGFALVLEEDNTDLYIYDTIGLTSKGDNAVMSKNVSVNLSSSSATSKLQLDGNYLLCGTLEDNSLIGFINGKVVDITTTEFENYLKPITVTFEANGGAIDDAKKTKTVYNGQIYGTLPVLTREYYTFNGWFTAATGGEKVTEETIVDCSSSEKITLYAQWTQNTLKVTFDANGGTVGTESKMVPVGDTYGELPVPARTNCTFDGWYTENGEKVTAETFFLATDDVTLKAYWTSDWILESALPADGETLSEKWTYDLKTDHVTKDSAEAEEYKADGYTLYDTTEEWSEYGPWRAWSTTKYTASDSREVESKTVTDRDGYTEYRYMRYSQKNSNRIHWCPYLGGLHYGGEWKEQWTDWSTSRLQNSGRAGSCSCHGEITQYGPSSGYYYYEESRYIAPVTHKEYRYRDRHLIYTYYLSKTEQLESLTEITASDAGENETISNIQKKVKYVVQ